MAGRAGPKRRGRDRGSVGAVGARDLAGLLPIPDSDDEITVTEKKASASPHQVDWSVFSLDKEETLTKPAAAAAAAGGKSEKSPKSGIAKLFSRSPRSGPNPASPGSAKTKRKKRKEKNTAVDEHQQSKVVASKLHAGIGEEHNDVEAARPSPLSRSAPVGKMASEATSDNFELNKDRSPATWMRVRDTTGTPFLWYTVLLQIAIACCSAVFLASNEENQLSWKTGCWGSWTSLTDAEGIEFVEFDTNVGWKLFGKEDKLGILSEVSERAAVMGDLAEGIHTLLVFATCGFFFFPLSALWLSNDGLWSASRETSGKTVSEGKEESTKPSKRNDNPLGLAGDCHRWMFVMAIIYVFAGLWCFAVGCVGFYSVVTRDFTDGLEEIISELGNDVTCATAQTSPRYGFFVNGLSVFLCFGGGIISFYMTYTADRDLGEAVEMWKRDRAETAEMASRRAMVTKKEEYAARVAAAASSAANTPLPIFKRKSATPSLATDNDDESPHNAGLSPVDLDSDEGESSTDGVVPARPVLQSALASPERQKSPASKGVRWDLESGPGADGGGADDNMDEGVVDEDLPPPEGWEVRSTPMGAKFWVNLVTEDVSWDRPTG